MPDGQAVCPAFRYGRGIGVLWQGTIHRFVAFPHQYNPVWRVMRGARNVTETICAAVPHVSATCSLNASDPALRIRVPRPNQPVHGGAGHVQHLRHLGGGSGGQQLARHHGLVLASFNPSLVSVNGQPPAMGVPLQRRGGQTALQSRRS